MLFGNPPPQTSEQKRSQPLWETIVIVISFLVLWMWILSRQSAINAGRQLAPWWSIVLAIALVALVVVWVRRLRRVMRAFRGEDEEGNLLHGSTPPWMPPGSPPRNGRPPNGYPPNGRPPNGRSPKRNPRR